MVCGINSFPVDLRYFCSLSPFTEVMELLYMRLLKFLLLITLIMLYDFLIRAFFFFLLRLWMELPRIAFGCLAMLFLCLQPITTKWSLFSVLLRYKFKTRFRFSTFNFSFCMPCSTFSFRILLYIFFFLFELKFNSILFFFFFSFLLQL